MNRLSYEMKLRGMSARQLSLDTKLSLSKVSRLRNGFVIRPVPRDLALIGGTLGIPSEELLKEVQMATIDSANA